MKMSIITVVRNCAGTIGEAIESVAAQSHAEVEHLIIDGDSTDGTTQVIDRYRARLAHVVSEPDQGIYDAMNKGIALATGDVIGFLNADDAYADDRVLSDVAERLQDDNVDAVYGDLVYVAAADTERVVRYWRSGEYRVGCFRNGWMPAHPTFFVRRRIYQQFGGFDLSYKLQSDFDLTMRFMEVQKIRSVYVPRVLVRMRTGGATNRSVRNVIKGNLEAYRACKKNALPVSPLFVLRKLFSRLPQFLSKPDVGYRK